jgi:hypothetical protein
MEWQKKHKHTSLDRKMRKKNQTDLRRETHTSWEQKNEIERQRENKIKFHRGSSSKTATSSTGALVAAGSLRP